ncbi:unnamed protein product [Schistosoma turkestanicum]|nr:unnamed protein product [Schistosoma turkestanicum]
MNYQKFCGLLYFRYLRSKSKALFGKRLITQAAMTPGKLDTPDHGKNQKNMVANPDMSEHFPDDVNPESGERGGPRGPEPTRYGDWERKGRCIDF